jgi:hypothetical protein
MGVTQAATISTIGYFLKVQKEGISKGLWQRRFTLLAFLVLRSSISYTGDLCLFRVEAVGYILVLSFIRRNMPLRRLVGVIHIRICYWRT